jgi:hypothetical protein
MSQDVGIDTQRNIQKLGTGEIFIQVLYGGQNVIKNISMEENNVRR